MLQSHRVRLLTTRERTPLTSRVSEIAGYLSRPDVRNLLGVDRHVPPVFTSINWAVNAGFHAADDSLRVSTAQVGALLERGVRVLIYVGTYDWICNWVCSFNYRPSSF